MKRLLIAALLIIIPYSLNGFDELLFKPLTANVFEPRIGSSYQFSSEKLRLDIGASFDLSEINISKNLETRFGVDFFTYTRLRSEGSFKFPVETSDYFFGVNFSAKKQIQDFMLSGRLRISHISSHLVDGYATGNQFNKTPFVYSREFTDLVFAAKYKIFRFYMGWQLLFSKIPRDFAANNYQLGFDFERSLLSFLYLNGGYDLKIKGIGDIYTAVHSLQLGLYIAMSEKTGISFDYNYFDGKSIHGMFYNERDVYSSAGFRIIYYY